MSLKNYKTGLKKTSVNYTPLSPVSFLERTANIFPNYTSIISEKKNLLGGKLLKDVTPSQTHLKNWH